MSEVLLIKKSVETQPNNSISRKFQDKLHKNKSTRGNKSKQEWKENHLKWMQEHLKGILREGFKKYLKQLSEIFRKGGGGQPHFGFFIYDFNSCFESSKNAKKTRYFGTGFWLEFLEISDTGEGGGGQALSKKFRIIV